MTPGILSDICQNSMWTRSPGESASYDDKAMNGEVKASMELSVYDIGPFIEGCDACKEQQLASGIADSLQRTGCVIIRDRRVAPSDNQRFLDTMEAYFARGTAANLADARPELHYQVGATPEGVEVPLASSDATLQALIAQQPPQHRATPLAQPNPSDPKWRFMWRIGPRPKMTAFRELNANPVIPSGIEDWAEIMDHWGDKMLAAVRTTAELAAIGLGLPASAFRDRMVFGPHLLAPTGANMEKHGSVGKVLAGFHSDLNFLTIHGKSRYPGLHVWLRNGTRAAVRVPDSCLLIQAGQQMEYLTGGAVQAGMHEVVVTNDTLPVIEAAKAAGRPLWRVSSTVFAHIASDQTLEPLAQYATADARAQYPPIAAGLFVEQQLQKIALAPHKQKTQAT